jgi:hypothetical protein
MLPDLNTLLEYKNQHLYDRYRKDYPANKISPEAALQEALKYLWICEKHRLDKEKEPANEALIFDMAVHHEMKEIDDMWHTFILFTKEYMTFCNTHFGRFIHHAPNVDTTPIDPIVFEKEFERYLSYVYDNLGEETLALWFEELLAEDN